MSVPQVSIRFCGGCNPRIDRGRIARELRDIFESMGMKVIFNSKDADIVVYLSGCLSGCAWKFYPADAPHVTVADHTVDTAAIDEDRIVPEVTRKVKEYYERLETEIRKKDNDGGRRR
jgi:hypothetical protein